MRLALLLALIAVPLAAAQAEDRVRANYLLACRGCHLVDGSGVPPEVPSLRGTLGLFTTSKEGRGYLVRVPGVAQSRLNDEELAEVINWVLAEFNASSLPAGFRPFTAREVAAVRGDILADPVGYRGELLAKLVAE
jgi:mono/diheme cytochrome c family protein